MKIGRVSICMPAFKAERYLVETLASVRHQTYTDWELVVVEDGSRDGTEALLQDFATEGPQPVLYFRHENNLGLSQTRNTGFENANSDVLALLDSDDLWRPNHLESCVAELERSGADVVFSGCELFDSETKTPLEQRVPPTRAMDEFPLSLHDGRVVIQPSAVVLKRTAITHIGGFDPQFAICNDLDCWFRIARHGYRFSYTGQITCDYRKHRTALSKRSADLIAERAAIHRLHKDWKAIPARQRRREVWRHHRDAARMIARSSPVRSLRLLFRGSPLAGLLS
jgi:glycosyltransferase involved in cell wall biosynthesis